MGWGIIILKTILLYLAELHSSFICLKIFGARLGSHNFNPSTCETEAVGSLCLKSAKLHNKTLTQKKKMFRATY